MSGEDDLNGLENALNNMPPRGSLCIGESRFEVRQIPEGVIVNESMWNEIFGYAPPLDVTKTGPAEYMIASIDKKMKVVVVLDSPWRTGKSSQNSGERYLKADVESIIEMQTPDGIEPARAEWMPFDVRFYPL